MTKILIYSTVRPEPTYKQEEYLPMETSDTQTVVHRLKGDPDFERFLEVVHVETIHALLKKVTTPQDQKALKTFILNRLEQTTEMVINIP